MKKAGMKKGKNKEFSTPYTVSMTKEIITKLSLLIMGLGNIAHKQIGKGIMFLAVEAAYIWYMIQSGIYNLSMLPSLGWRDRKYGNEFMNIRICDQSSPILCMEGNSLYCSVFIIVRREVRKELLLVGVLAKHRETLKQLVSPRLLDPRYMSTVGGTSV